MSEREEGRNWRWNMLARITQLTSFGFDGFADIPADEQDCRVRSALHQIGNLVLRCGAGGWWDVRMAERQMFRVCALDWLNRLIVEFGRDDNVVAAIPGDALEVLATFVFANCNEIVTGVADEFGLDSAVEARRADEMGALPRRDIFGAERIDGESGDGDAAIAAERSRRSMVRALGFTFALLLGRTAIDCLKFGFEGCYFKVKFGDLTAAKERSKALRILSDALAKLENGGNVCDIHDSVREVVKVFCG